MRVATRFPNRMVIEVRVGIEKLARAPAIDGTLQASEGLSPLPALEEVEGRRPFARVYAAWWQRGIYVAARVGKVGAVAVNRQRPLQNDCLLVLLNTAPGPDQRRPTRSCYQFIALPRGGGRSRMEPVVYQEHFRYGPPQRLAKPRELRIASAIRPDAYDIELAILASAIGDVELEEGLLLGFEYLIHDTQQGTQTWAAPAGAPVLDVPALWGQVELVQAENAS